MFSRRDIVFEASLTVNCTSRFAVYSVPSDGWTNQHASQYTTPENSLILGETELKRFADIAEDASLWTSQIRYAGAEIDGVSMYNAIAVLCCTTSTLNTKRFVVVLVPHTISDLLCVKVVFVPMAQLAGYTVGNTRYKAFKNHEFDEHLGKELFLGCRLCFFRSGTVLRTPSAPKLKGKRRASEWRRAVRDDGKFGNRYLERLPPAPQNVRMAVASM
jgi:hypothetical protein